MLGMCYIHEFISIIQLVQIAFVYFGLIQQQKVLIKNLVYIVSRIIALSIIENLLQTKQSSERFLFINPQIQTHLHLQYIKHFIFIPTCSLNHINLFAPMQVRYRIQSFSSQHFSFPISNLLSKHSPWQSARFCEYPQQITISFYQPIAISMIKIASHPTKVPSRINILYHLPEYDDKGFVKYGFITFSEGQANGFNNLQVKQMSNIGIKALEIRFIILKNHMNKHNFFNQIGITFLNIYGTTLDYEIPAWMPKQSTLLSFDPQINILNQLKSSLIKKQQFQEAKQVKQMLKYINKAEIKLNQLENQKQKRIKEQDFIGAKKMKQQMLRFKLNMSDAVNHFYDPQRQTIKNNKSHILLRKKIQQLSVKSSIFNFQSQNKKKPVERVSRVRQGQSQYMQQIQVVSEDEAQYQGLNRRDETILSHQERIVPAVLNKIKGMGQTTHIQLQNSQVADNQFYEDTQNNYPLPNEPQPLSPSDQANSSLLTQFYDSSFIKKLHSKYWQFKFQVTTQVLSQMISLPVNLPKNRLRSLIFIYSTLISSHNYQIAHSALQLMNSIAQLKPASQFRNELHNQLQNSINLTLKKLSDSNQKIKSQVQKTLLKIIESEVFGVNLCYQTISKSYNYKVSHKIRKIKIQNIQYMVEKYGIGENGVPYSIVDFSLKAANDQNAQVRKSVINLLKSVKERGGKQRLENLLFDLNGMKPSIAKQILL